MAAHTHELKTYQRQSLDAFRTFLRDVPTMGADFAFYKATKLPYRNAPAIADGTPYVCLRVPTGGGKTILASHAVGAASREFMQAQNPVVLWLVPSTPILDQTVAALKNLDHPYRAALAKDFGRNVTIMTKAEALAISRADAEGGACIIVSTIQSFRREDENGKENPEGVKVYADNGSLMDHFSGLSEAQREALFMVDGTSRPVASLANILRLHRPMIIVDEAHNARTALSFDTLARFRPSLILELTATPQTEHAPSKDKYASNILHSVSAAELKAEEMIKMPIRLTTDRDWRKTIGAACDCQAMLEEAANAEQRETGEYIRPLVLFQSQSASKTDPHRLTWEVIEKHLIEDRGIAPERIAVHTGPRKDLDGIKIEADDCPVRFVITQQKLKEGWDCPFAYIFCSVAEQASTTAVEQILGRVLRLPKAQWKKRDALNQAYAFVASNSFDETAAQLRDGLVEGAGFNRLEAEQLVSAQGALGFSEHEEQEPYHSDPLDDDDGMDADDLEAAIAKMPASVKSRITVNRETKSIIYRGPMTKENRNLLQLGLASSQTASKAITRLYARSNNFQMSASEDQEKPAFIVPLLARWKQGELRLFNQEQFLDLPWRLDECDAGDIVNRFRLVDQSQTGQIDVSDKGKVEIEFARRMQAELSAVIQEPTWTLPRLVNWIDSGIQHPDVTKPSANIFMVKAIEALIAAGHPLDVLARNKYDLRRALQSYIHALRGTREDEIYNALFAADAGAFATSSDLAIVFDERTYAFNQPYAGGTRFQKHYTPIVGDLKPSGEEFDCAVYLDRMEAVDHWIRNVDRKPNSFWLQLPKHRFYPDFVASLKDGRVLVVEYKGEDRFEQEDERDKRRIGEIWADAMGGKGLFCMPTARDFSTIDKTVST